MYYRLILTVFLLFSSSAYAQDQRDDDIAHDQDLDETYQSGDEKIRHFWGFNIQISTDGFLLGGTYNRKIAAYTHLSVSADMFWVKGQNEMVDFWGRTLNAENILIVPLVFTVKRRLFPEDMTNTFRPFVAAGAGGVYGYYISGDLKKSQLPPDHDRSQYAPTAIAGIGADFGKPGQNGYGMDVRYQLLRFPNSLGQRKSFNNLQIGFHMNF